MALMTIQVYANSSIKQMFTSQYDNQGSELDKCTTCMRSASSSVSWNQYGAALRNDPDFNRNNVAQALENIEEADSDGDGFSNIDEIRNSTFPGDSDDFPEVMEVTETEMETSTVTADPTEAAIPTTSETKDDNSPLNSIFNALFTCAAIVVVSILVRKKNAK